MELRLLFFIDIISLMLMPILSFSQKNVVLSIIIFCANQMLCFFLVRYPRKVYELIKLPETLRLGLGLMQWVVLINQSYIFALYLVVLFFLMMKIRNQERRSQSERLGPRFSHYDYWVADFLPSWIPTSRLPAVFWQNSASLLSRLTEPSNILSIILAIFSGLSLIKPNLSSSLHIILGSSAIIWFAVSYGKVFKFWFNRKKFKIFL